MPAHPIDAVIAWVDGADPRHAAKRHRWEGDGVHVRARAATRFSDLGEVYLCLAALLTFAPFLRTIWLVTDDQRPAGLEGFEKGGPGGPGRIRVVDHRTIFAGFEEALPTFSSLSIEAVLWRIPGLAEHHVYLNDDFILNAPASPGDFFRDGLPVLHGRTLPPRRTGVVRRLRNRLKRLAGMPLSTKPMDHFAQELGARLAGRTDGYLRAEHHPHPLRVSTQAAFHAERPDVLPAQLLHRFRHRDQYSPVSLANHLEMARHGAPVGPEPPLAYVEPGQAPVTEAVLDQLRTGSVPYACLQSLDQADPGTLRLLRDAIEPRLAGALPPGLGLRAIS